MKALSILKKAAVGSIAAVMVAVYAFATPAVQAIPYTPEATGTNYPAFNAFTGVPVEGNEADFVRGKEATDTNPSVDNVQSACNKGTEYTVRVYVHNVANQTLNNDGNGPAVAHGTKVKVSLPSEDKASKFTIGGKISATNATTVNDTMSINCGGGKVVKLSYVSGSARQFTGFTGTKALSDSIVTTGAPIGTMEPNGDVWGCFAQRVWVTLTVKVEDVAPEPKPSLGECKLLDVKAVGGRKINYEISGTTDNAEIVGYRIDFGDGNNSTEQSGEHEYAEDGTYTVKGEVRVKYADGREEWKSADNCVKQVTFEGDQPPKVVPPTPTPGAPTTLPVTGPAGVAAVVTAVTGMSSAAYYWVIRRRGEV